MVKKVYILNFKLTLLPLYFNLKLTLQNEMSVTSGAVYRLNIDYLYQAKSMK